MALDKKFIRKWGGKMNKRITIAVLVTLLVYFGGTRGFSQVSALEKPAANLTERWSTNSSGWTNTVAVSSSCGWTNGALAVQSSGANLLGGDTLKLMAQTGASGGIFFGNYTPIEAVTFDVQPYDVMSSVSFYFKGSTGRTWTFPILRSYINGEKVSMTIPFSYSTNWTGTQTDIESRFAADKTNINEIGFLLSRGPNDTNVQQFAIDNMKLVGPWGGPFTSNGVPLAWVIETGLTNDFTVAGMNQDNDHDNFSNVAEFLAGTDPTDSNSFFKIEIGRNDSGQMVVRWPGNNVANYVLLEANSLGATSEFVTNSVISPVTVKTQEVAVEQPSQATKFFKVMITPKGN